jgi:hypothetical protein
MSVERVGGHHSRRVDTRVVAATNRDLPALVKAGRFRADLYYRLSGVEIQVPPLRARREDVPQLVDHFLAWHRSIRSLACSDDAREALTAYDWPGNVRQLERVLERVIALSAGPVIAVSDLPADMTQDYRDILVELPGRDDSLRAWTAGTCGSCSSVVRETSGEPVSCWASAFTPSRHIWLAGLLANRRARRLRMSTRWTRPAMALKSPDVQHFAPTSPDEGRRALNCVSRSPGGWPCREPGLLASGETTKTGAESSFGARGHRSPPSGRAPGVECRLCAYGK